jgi:8-oxo-dGTP pyrophosphatase MutT (NUDIX family)
VTDVVRAAGGIILRRSGGGQEILLVHRPKYDDWSLPKGKADPGETDEACALREVEEETGLVCSLGPEVAVTEYVDGNGRPKRVRYFLMTPTGDATASHEIDEVRWLPLDEAAELLSYDRDRRLVEHLAAGVT